VYLIFVKAGSYGGAASYHYHIWCMSKNTLQCQNTFAIITSTNSVLYEDTAS